MFTFHEDGCLGRVRPLEAVEAAPPLDRSVSCLQQLRCPRLDVCGVLVANDTIVPVFVGEIADRLWLKVLVRFALDRHD